MAVMIAFLVQRVSISSFSRAGGVTGAGAKRPA
jgi:hypothetical protein